MGRSSEGSHIILIGFLISGVLTALGNASEPMPGSCSVNKYLTCAPDAECKDDLDANTFTCTCKDDVVGDGLKGERNTGCVHRCQFSSDCHTYAFCNEDAMCQCNANFTGDGIDICNDIDECENANIYCHKNAKCRNSVGGYSCTCDEKNNYFGDGVNCIHKCTMDNHCSKNEECNSGICECEPGYKEMSGCKDINECLDGTDECDAYGVCINTDGGYKCPCKNGYTQDGEFGCKAIPKTCHDIWMENNNSNDGQYVIDPDGSGEIEAFEVECEMREIGITIINRERARTLKVTFEKQKVEFIYEHSLERIRAIIESSGFCYQEHRYQCRGGALLMDGSNYWKSGNNEHEKNWGGSTSDNMCACGMTGYCTDRAAACNCNGTTETMDDNGKVIDKDKLPLVAVSINPGAQGEGRVYVGPVKCGPNPFDIPLNCHEYKFDPIYKVRKDGSYFIDSDGQKGELKPELVYCDMESYTHVGVTIIPHKSIYPVVVPEPGEYEIEYLVGKLSIESLIDGSQYCMQEVSYECKNSRLMNNGDHKGFTKSLNGGIQNYWAGGLENTCGCGLLGVCDEEGYKCNCDIRDDKTRTDFGLIRDKKDLPVGSLTFKEIGGNSSGTYHVGPLMCGGKEFGIRATCQDYVEEGYTTNYAFLIDPDGPQTTDLSTSNEINHPAFPVYCEFRGDPLYATTIVKHNHEQKYEWTSSNDLLIEYTMANRYQLEALVSRHVTCTQEFTYSCKGAPIHDASGNSLAEWWNSDGEMFSYFAGDGSNNKTCGCGLVGSCDGKGLCSCDVGGSQQRHDDGVISDKENLPIAGFSVRKSMDESSFAVAVEIGSLKCRELFPNCAEQKLFNRQYRLEGETIVGTGSYVIDADGNGEVEPFYVQCIGSKTVIEVEIEPPSNLTSDSNNGVSRCYNISYKSNGYPVTSEQVQALVHSSLYCTQELTKLCLNAPLTNHTTFKTCDRVEQAGWAGSKGEDMCACGTSGMCAGGPGAKCNCDLQNGEMLEDGAWISDINRLAVCQVCESLDPVNTLSVSPKKRQSMPTVSDLFCDSGPIGKSGSCQDLRNNGMVESGTVSLTPKGSESAPFYCGLQVYPPMGWTEIYPKEPEIVLNTTEVDITIYYYVYSMEVMYKLIEQSTYCTQELHLDCVDSSLSIGGKYGWYSRDGVVQEYWAGAEKGTQGCKDSECQCNLEGVRVDGGVVQELLPISRIVLPAAPGERTLRIGPVKCYNIYRDCHEILKKRARTNPLKNNTYTIDPDQGGPIEPFAVLCDFKTDRKIGITVIDHLVTEEMKIVPQKGISVNIEYEVTYEQIHSLASISGFCLQGIKYVCRQAPLTEPSGGFYYNTFGMEQSPSFGVSDSPEVIGCPCVLLKTCPDGFKCHCDAVEDKFVVDYGFETNRKTLPLQIMNFPRMSNNAQSVFDITNVRCAPTPFDLPKHCDEAYYRGFSSGEILIWPSKKVKPFLVYCNMKVGKGGVTIIGNNYETEVPITFDSTMKVSYTNAYSKQIVELVLISSYCYQPFKINCRNMKLLNGTYASWQGDQNDFEKNSFGGEKNDNLCNCGRQGYCAGDEAYDVLEPLGRPCNCDASDGIGRLDAGVFNYSGQAIQALYFADSGLPDQNGAVTLGKLYCSEHDFDINECKDGWHDCHEHAKCINRKGYFECKCRSGWGGLGRKENETVQWANGRNCYDDDECHLKSCPPSADCENTPGSFICTCKDGYRQIGARSCADIDECDENTHTCHANAKCLNLPGSYDCRCDWNYKGDGFSCEPVALCACFGDPHCLTFDQKLITFQGTCQYVMARDMCDNINDTPTFELLMSFYVIPGIQTTSEVSWVKELDFNYDGYTIKLLQNNEVWVDGRKKNLPYKKNNIEIRAVGKFVDVYTQLGLQLTWDGKQDIELYTPGQFMNKTCGFCGNYNGNPKDDLMIGPACEASEGQVTTNENIFGNSWVAPDYAAEFPQCVDCDAENETEVCTDLEKAKAELHCKTIFDKNGEFKACFEVLDKTLYESYKYSCVYDACRMGTGDAMLVVCDSAEMMVDVCSSHYQIDIVVEDLRKFCEPQCNENMEYQSCGSNQQVTCYDVLTETEPDVSDLASCVGGCFCKEDFYLSADGKSCVPKEECGCYYEDENYKIGDVITSDDCSGNLICQANGTMTSENLNCHKDAVCKVKKGRQGCHCKKDYYGDGVISCEEDKCLKNPCGTNETCIQNKKAELGYECRCQMGFMGDCGNCTEVDECLTKEGDCPYKAHCINTVGSFKCECKEGYDLFGGVCIDVNECSLAQMNEESVCRNNSQCSNRIGTFECPCCNGFEEKNGKCVESSTSNEISPTCCVCNIAKCEDPREICGEDGQTYENMKEMYLKYCELGKEKNLIKVDYFGKCKSSCAGVTCLDYQDCTVIDDRATCICAGCTEEDKSSPEVCTKDKVQYENMCAFKTSMCYFDIEFTPSFDMEPCNGIGGAEPVGPWGAWGQCSVTCGKGTSVKTRIGYNLSPAQEEEFPLELATDCYMDPCPGSPCVGHDECPLAGYCVVNSKGEPTCECPTCENIGVDPVCGYIVGQTGRVVKSSWKSECHLRRFVCNKEQIDYEVMNEGFCGAVPRNCTRVPLAHTITDGSNDEYTSKSEENIFDCEGGCGFIRDDCCQPIKTSLKSVYVYNSNGDRKSVEVKVIEKCGCVDIGGEL